MVSLWYNGNGLASHPIDCITSCNSHQGLRAFLLHTFHCGVVSKIFTMHFSRLTVVSIFLLGAYYHTSAKQ